MRKKTNIYLAVFTGLFIVCVVAVICFQKPIESFILDDRVVTKMNPAGQIGIVVNPAPANYKEFFDKVHNYSEIPHYNSQSQEPFQIDLRSLDVSKLDATGRTSDLLFADFDSCTIWPQKLPAGFEPDKLMNDGKNPGLGVRALQTQGITGKGIGIAIIDQELLTTHQEFAKQLRSYEMIHCFTGDNNSASMHGPAVASIAVGKSVGVAPDADLFYIAATFGNVKKGGDFKDDFEYDCAPLAQSIEHILDMNKLKQVNGEIRVISISWGPSANVKNYSLYSKAIERAKKENVLVITTSMRDIYGIGFTGLDRKPYSSADDANSFIPGSWLQKGYYNDPNADWLQNDVWLPMGNRTTASPTGNTDYVYYANGGYSWVAPYLAGLYALACQVNPNVTPDLFLKTIMKTGEYTTHTHDGKQYKLGPIANPQKLIEALRK